MDQNDRRAIEGLFDKLGQAARQNPARDADADRFIADEIARQPGAPYYMAQTIVMQEHALNAAQARMAEMEAEVEAARHAAAARPQQGGLLSRLFGGAPAPAPRPMPRPAAPQPMAAPAMAPNGMAQNPMMGQRPGFGAAAPQGGGFLAGAAQTAMGVAGGMLLANAVGSMFAGEAEAATAPVAEPYPEPVEEPVEDYVDDAGYVEDEWEE